MTSCGPRPRSWLVLLCTLHGCGRVSFDAVPDATHGDANVDGAVDGMVDASGLVTKTFGERTGANFTGVTTDTTLNAVLPTNNYGGDASLTVDDGASSVIRFDLSSIPTGATLVSASLTIWTNPASSTPDTVEVFELIEAWAEGTGTETIVSTEPATYNERLPGTSWSGPGASNGSRGVRIAAFTPLSQNSPYTSQLANVVVAKWIAQPSTNYGMVFDLAGTNAVGLVSRNSVRATARPMLTVAYIP
ncbi:MAG: DNRLRE domain-containing protein [Kofleriaceae bacterium]